MYTADRNADGSYEVTPIAEPHPYRVEVKTTAKGEKQISVRATSETAEGAVQDAVKMFFDVQQEIGV